MKSGRLVETLKVLRRLGVALPDDTTEANLVERLHVAALTCEAQRAQAPLRKRPADEGRVYPGPDHAASHAVGLSLNRIRKAIARQERPTIRRRIDALLSSDRVTRATRDQLLSDAAAGDSSLAARLEVYEALPPGAALPLAARR
jgi:hypothetical protein